MPQGNRILITGSSGMLGSSLVTTFQQEGKHKVFGVSHHNPQKRLSQGESFQGDLRNPDFLREVLAESRPDIIIHCAAETNLDACEKDPEMARSLHEGSTRSLSLGLKPGGKLLYVSTDSVFDGHKGAYGEEDQAVPSNAYARTKLKGEQAALEGNHYGLVLRTNLYGFHEPMRSSMLEWAWSSLSQGREVKGFEDVMVNPVYTGQLSSLVKQLCERDYPKGILHIGCDEQLSKLDLLLKFARIFGFDARLIRRASVDEHPFLAKRPKNTTLALRKLSSWGLAVPSLEEGLSQFKKDLERSLSPK